MRRILFILLLVLPFVGAVSAHAQGGPPFITDDPAPPGNHHWEINFGWIANHNPGQSYYEIPDVDMNYGWGNRIQLKWEQPLAAGTNADNSTGVGLGESLLGIKFRAYQHYIPGKEKTDDNINFSIGTYPQVSLNTPAGSAQRGIVEPGPQYYLPMEVTTQLGWLALDGEVGRWIGNTNEPDQWGRGLIAGHEFSDRLELYTEIYDLQAINRIGDQPSSARSRSISAGASLSIAPTTSACSSWAAVPSRPSRAPTVSPVGSPTSACNYYSATKATTRFLTAGFCTNSVPLLSLFWRKGGKPRMLQRRHHHANLRCALPKSSSAR